MKRVVGIVFLLAVAGVVFSLQRIRAERTGIRLAVALGAVALLAQAAHWIGPLGDLGLASALAQTGFYLTAAALQVRYILRDTHATVDELYSAAVAFLLVLFLAPPLPLWQACAFLLFRLFDILKPPPIRYYDQTFKSGFGAMLDDMVAAFYALIILALAKIILQ